MMVASRRSGFGVTESCKAAGPASGTLTGLHEPRAPMSPHPGGECAGRQGDSGCRWKSLREVAKQGIGGDVPVHAGRIFAAHAVPKWVAPNIIALEVRHAPCVAANPPVSSFPTTMFLAMIGSECSERVIPNVDNVKVLPMT